MAKIIVLHGPNLNLLGNREPEHYGRVTLDDINQKLINQAKQLGHKLIAAQFNAEHAMVDFIHQAPDQDIDFILINPAAFTHTSVAIRDALTAVGIPFIEIHLSNVYKREPFRQLSYFSDVAVGVICGFGAQSYELALQAAHKFLTKES